MAFTKIAAAGIGTTETVTVDGLTVINNGSFGGNLTVSGVLTYEDVTNVDSVGLITARNGIVVGSGITLSKDGDIFATGISTFSEDIKVGSGITLSPDGDVFATGIATFTKDILVGSGITLSPDGDVFVTGIATFTKDILVGSGITLSNDGDVYATGIVTAREGIFIPDSQKLELGNASGSGDLKIYHDGNNSYIQDSGTGNLIIKGSDNLDITSAGDELKARFITNGAVELYHNNIKKLQTSTTDGVIIGNTTDDANYTNALTLTRRGYETSGYGVRIQAKGGSASGQNGLKFKISDGSGSNYTSRFSFTNDGLLFNSDTATANALDDYEEGTWSITVNPGSGSYSVSHMQASYVKVGNVVHVQGWWRCSGGSFSGSLGLFGLPFTTFNNTGSGGLRQQLNLTVAYLESYASGVDIHLRLADNGTSATFQASEGLHEGFDTLTAGNIKNTTAIYINGSYIAA